MHLVYESVNDHHHQHHTNNLRPTTTTVYIHTVWVARDADMIEGHIVGVVARPSHQPVAELLAEVNDKEEAVLLASLGEEEEGEGEQEEEEGEEQQVLAGDRITTEDALGWAPSTEIDLSAVPSVVDEDFFMQVRVWMCVDGGRKGRVDLFV